MWLDFLTTLAQAAQAESALLQLFVQGRQTQQWRGGQHLSNGPPEPQLMRQGRVYSQVDLPGPGNRDQPLRALKWPVGADGFGLLTLERRERDFRAVDGLHLSNLLPYLGQAVLGWQAMRLDHDRAALDRRMARGLGAAWMVLGLAGHVLDMTPWLRDWLEQSRDLRLRGGRLEFADAGLGQGFQQALAGAGAGTMPRRPVQLSRDPPLAMVLSPGQHAGERVLIAALRSPRPARSLAPEDVAAAFDLGRSEARLAMLICDGFSLADAAAELGWTLETARSCSKQIYARMGVAGQTGVLRHMLNSPIWLATPTRPLR